MLTVATASMAPVVLVMTSMGSLERGRATRPHDVRRWVRQRGGELREGCAGRVE